MNGRKMRVLIAAGGSGGHLFPSQQLYEELKEGAEVCFGGHKLKESPFFAKEKIPFAEIPAASLGLKFIPETLRGLVASFKLLKSFRPDVVVGFGSFHTFPLLLAAVLLRKKMVLFEANVVLGKVNRFFRPFSKAVGGQFPLKKGVLVPLLPWKQQKREEISKEKALSYFGLQKGYITALVFGGSQGAGFFNREIPPVLERLAEKGVKVQVIHCTGKGEAVYKSIPASVKPFEKEMEKAYALADLCIGRSGAGTVAELILHKLPALLIPFPFASEDHQRKNGEFLAHAMQGARLLLEKEATREKILEEIEHLVENREVYRDRLEKLGTGTGNRTPFAKLVQEIGA